MNAALLAVQLRARGAALAAALVARVRRMGRDGEARFGRRDRLADPHILWPGDER